MNVAVGPVIGNLAAFMRRITPGPASNKNTRVPSMIAVAGPEAAGSGRGTPVPSNTMTVESPPATGGRIARAFVAAPTSSVPASRPQTSNKERQLDRDRIIGSRKHFPLGIRLFRSCPFPRLFQASRATLSWNELGYGYK